MTFGYLEPGFQPSQEECQIGSLSSIESVQFIHHHIPECALGVLTPQPPVLGPDQQVVEHFIVGEQDVWRIISECGPIGDDTRWSHCHLSPAIPTGPATDEQSHSKPSEQRRRCDDLREATGLISRQRVHGVDDQRFDAFATLLR